MPPASFLLGSALLFWGWMTDRMWVGVLCALLVEAGRYSRIRWSFGEVACVRAWRLSVLVMVITLALVLMDRADVRAMARVFSWLPVILLPLQFVQSYGTSRVIGLGTFSLMVRRRRLHAEKYGLPFREVYFSFGWVYLAGILISSALGTNASNQFFFPLMVSIIGWALLSSLQFSWAYLPVVLGLSLIPAAGAAFAGGKGMMQMYSRLIGLGSGSQAFSDRARVTGMGDLGELKQSPEINFRIKRIQGPPPKLLRLSSYQTYSNGRWTYADLPRGSGSLNQDFRELPEVQNPENPDDPEDKFVQCAPGDGNLALVRSDLPRFHLLGNFPAKGLLPLPGGAASFHGIGLYTDLNMNSLGTVRYDPVDPVVDMDVLWSDDFSTEQPPWQRTTPTSKRIYTWPDLDVPEKERAAVNAVVEELQLKEGSVVEKITRLRDYFARNFEYSLYNDTPKQVKEGDTLVTTFLRKTRRGHCEFFATSAALILRAAEVPTRYASGFAVVEFNQARGEFFIRGTHAHAWCRAWDAVTKKWIDVDLTPPAWLGMEKPTPARFQGLQDWWKIKQESFLVWRSKPGRMTIVAATLLTPVAIGLVVIGRILWKSRQKAERAHAIRRGATVFNTPLTSLEKPACRVLGHRPEGMPLAAWLAGLHRLLDRPELLTEALALHQEIRFDPGMGSDPTREGRLMALTAELSGKVRQLPKKAELS